MRNRLARRSLTALSAIAVAGAPLLASANAPLFPKQWGLTGAASSINAPQAWCASLGDGIKVADVDTGAQVDHPDLAGQIIATARFTQGDGQQHGTDVTDDVGHGTMTAGLIAAKGVGINGVAPHVKLLIAKALFLQNGQGTGNANDVAAAVDWAVASGANVINLSLGSNEIVSQVGQLDPLGPAIGRAEQHGVAVAVAAGNNGLPLADYANKNELIVGALDRSGNIASYSDFGPLVNVYGPGGDASTAQQAADPYYAVLSDYPGSQYAAGIGTSFAAPHVTGTLALLMAKGMSNSAAQQRVLGTLNSQTSGVDAAAALGTSGGCAGTPPITNDPGHNPPPTSGATGQARKPGGGAAGAAPSPSTPAGATSPSIGPDTALNSGQLSPSPRANSLQAIAPKPPSGLAVLLVAAGLVAVVAGAAGYFWLKMR
ncbi:MAG TPA: S8 family serine peptidase [Candidatus Solibacter sp.]|jgi:subtilisin family serine protease|nr:S8 family serine peptidase [Candidatus Solibacter sp.]